MLPNLDGFLSAPPVRTNFTTRIQAVREEHP